MSNKIGSIIEDGNGGESVTQSVSSVDSISANPTDRIDGPGQGDIYDGGTETGPRTIRIDTGNTGTAGNLKFTKDGRIDKRTKAGRFAGSEIGPQTPRQQTIGDRLSLKELLISLHLGLSAVLDTQELTLEETEAKRLADAFTEVGKYYAVNFDPKKVAIANLLIVAGGIYGPRFMAWKIRKSLETPEPTPVMSIDRPAPAPKAKTNGKAQTPSELWNEPGVSTEFSM